MFFADGAEGNVTADACVGEEDVKAYLFLADPRVVRSRSASLATSPWMALTLEPIAATAASCAACRRPVM